MQTVRVRIAVCISADGEWNSSGWSGSKNDADLAEHATEVMPAHSSVYFIEADVPLPTTIVGSVDGGKK